MTEHSVAIKKLVGLVDHKNLLDNGHTLKQLVHTVTASIQSLQAPVYFTLRAYGGWYSGNSITDERYEAITYYQDYCPTVLKTEAGLVRLSLQFADELAVSQERKAKVPITHTVNVRGSSEIKITKSLTDKCHASGCELTEVRKWVRKKTACGASHCGHQFSDFFQRQEQKQVDVHLALDLVWLAARESSDTAIVVVSDDIDILPAIIQASLQNPKRLLLHVRSATRRPTYQDALLSDLGIQQAIM